MKQLIQKEDLFMMQSVVNPQLAKNGRDLAFVVTTMDEKDNKYSSHLYYMDLEKEKQPKKWTSMGDKNISPIWNKDATKLLFVSNRNEKPQLFCLEKEVSEAVQLTSCVNGASNPLWVDEDHIVFTTEVKRGETILTEEKEEKKEQLDAYEVEAMRYKSDAFGLWNKKYTQIILLNIETKELTQLTNGETYHHLLDVCPCGKKIVYAANESEDKDFSFINDIYLLDLQTMERTCLTNGDGNYSFASFSPDGTKIAMIGSKDTYKNATHATIYMYDMNNQSLVSMIADEDVLVGDYVAQDFHQGIVAPKILWNENSESYYFLTSDHGNTVLNYMTLDGEMYPALLDKQYIYGASNGGNVDKIVVAIGKPNEPGNLYELTVTTGELRQLTHFNKEWKETRIVVDSEEFYFTTTDGQNIQGWVMKPANFETGKKYPLIVEIHGGPHAMYANSYMHEFQCLAAQGYAIMFINPRGSHGYSQAFVDAVRGDYGGKDYEDIMEAVDYVLETYDYIDSNRLAVTGGSYGGFMTNWIVGQTNRFKAAVTQRSISNWLSFYGVSDIGYYFTDWQIDADVMDIEKLWKHSPLAYVEKVETPLLILHSEQDLRCPIEQAEQLYIALKAKKKETKFVRFPNSNHDLSRNGKLNLRMQRLNYMIHWFNQYV